eukprot:5241029-Ditylum_brightwellii.AAC.1
MLSRCDFTVLLSTFVVYLWSTPKRFGLYLYSAIGTLLITQEQERRCCCLHRILFEIKRKAECSAAITHLGLGQHCGWICKAIPSTFLALAGHMKWREGQLESPPHQN